MPPRAPDELRSLVSDRGVQAGYAVLGALVVADLLSGVLLTATYTASAIAASMLTTARRTAYVVVVALVLAVGMGYLSEASGMEWLLRGSLSAALGVLAVVSAVVRDRREERLTRMTIIAATAQQALVSSLPSSVGHLDLAARYVSATAAAQVGGDLYEVTSTPYGVRVIVGDVKGKGIEGVRIAASVLSAFRHAAVTEPDVAAIARRMDGAIRELLTDEDFVTAVMAEFAEDTLTLANCGHPSPLLLDSHGAVVLEPPVASLPLGLGADPASTTHAWPPGARVLLYTDGLIEARDARGAFFPLEVHAAGLALGTPDQALDRLLDLLLVHAQNEIDDDLALVLTAHRPYDG